MAALPPNELKELMVAIAKASIKRTTRCLIEWQLHTMTRPAEAATTRWAGIDMEEDLDDPCRAQEETPYAYRPAHRAGSR